MAETKRSGPKLFEGPPPVGEVPFSKRYSDPEFRSRVGNKASWTAVNLVNLTHCDECFALQYETRGEYGHRADAGYRRRLRSGVTLLLCRRHGYMWHERDQAAP